MAQPFRFMLNQTETESYGAFIPRNLRPLIDRAIPHARAQISGSPVVAIGLASSGQTYFGVNVELPGLPPNYSIHAEQFLVANFALHFELKLIGLAISPNGYYFKAPCGHCCQFLREISNMSDTKVLITGPTGQGETHGTRMLLSTFLILLGTISPGNVPRLLEPSDNSIGFIDSSLQMDICSNSEHCNHLSCRALRAATKSYARFSKCPSGVALIDRRGTVYSGWFMESVAHNPSLGPVQAALVDFVVNGDGQEFKEIVEAVLVEKRGAVLSQEDTARMILEKIADPDCVFRVLHCEYN
ncbi:unnamed protein product [Arabidopsis lyrata]|uniref:CMP/dCMP-type deaminase domain-containing protein n=1 Tax=Arabidopsis lyrata subsp. lyrata TaxID=81972 RepID=D7MXZ2_ARALL|nr:cytidine deaminase 8 [Arabidopsis lyrata subsp. lyrata]EFH38590.1 hypothetical protein ARALYDRAFT_920886 [Arabidopsis lyrata subsp. lyrata]CAH8274922.1 unnamed protein product [Arabidopsis lyrata]|eukprot:XP_002862332.1 cytidine deaminase 8 [Arabidopsis lyrata subsp. lyrata]